jgi:M6 family metalloprotease-like protein
MRASIAVPVAILLLLAGSWFSFNGEIVENWIDEQRDTPPENTNSLVGLQSKESWIVVMVDFSDHPADSSENPSTAAGIIRDVANPFLNQTSGTEIEFDVIFYDQVIRAKYPMTTYGSDSGSVRDAGIDGINPASLVAEVIESIGDDIDWDKADYDKDGIIDRFLILHPAEPQEDGGGSSSRIWSHFSQISEVVETKSEQKIGHYVIASMASSTYRGTIMHEMLHQMGAVDLYPVHDEVSIDNWKGVGNWDIMASGNWNGQGIWPALPTAASMELLDVDRFEELTPSWPQSSGDCYGPNKALMQMATGGSAIRIEIDEGEYVWIELRGGFGFDNHLPGEGVLLLIQDITSGDIAENEVNSHPDNPWLAVIEADGRDDLLAGVGKGELSDLFQDGDVFGSDGELIYNRDGVLVDWNATVRDDNGTIYIDFASSGCGHSIDVDLPDHGSILLANESIPIEISGPCSNLSQNITSTDERNVTLENNNLVFEEAGFEMTRGYIRGQISCDEGSAIILDHEFFITRNRPVLTSFASEIPIIESSTILVPLGFEGNGSQSWIVGIDGPLARIAQTTQIQNLGDGDQLAIEINPDNLLTPGMIARGNVILATESGHRWQLEVTLTAQEEEMSTFDEWRQPEKIIPIACVLAALWFVLGIRKLDAARQPAPKFEEGPGIIFPVHSTDPPFANPLSETDAEADTLPVSTGFVDHLQ